MLIKNIKQLIQVSSGEKAISGADLKKIGKIENAWIRCEDGLISDFGEMQNLQEKSNEETIDAHGKFVLPTWVDSHTHLVFAGSREEEFEMRLKGKSYQEIAEAGGGILNSASRLQNTSEENLYNSAKKRLDEVIRMGTGAIEIKSGYGLTLEAELKLSLIHI